MIPSLVELCCRVLAEELLRGHVPEHFPADVPELELLLRIYNLFTVRSRAGPSDHTALMRQLVVLQAFADEWQVRQLRLSLPQPRSPRALRQLHVVASRLSHLELLDAPWLTDLTWLLDGTTSAGLGAELLQQQQQQQQLLTAAGWLRTTQSQLPMQPQTQMHWPEQAQPQSHLTGTVSGGDSSALEALAACEHPSSQVPWDPRLQHHRHWQHHPQSPSGSPSWQRLQPQPQRQPQQQLQPQTAGPQAAGPQLPQSQETKGPSEPPSCPLRLTCLVLRGCRGLLASSLIPLQVLSPWLRVLDLSGADGIDDGCAGVLACLRVLQVINLNHTRVGDPTMAALTYGARVAMWARKYGAPAPPEAAVWPELAIRRWHLMGTRVSGAGLALLGENPLLEFLDVRGSGVPRAALRPLESRFRLNLVQGAVLATSNALAATLINHPDHPACACSPNDVAALGPPPASATATARAARRQQAQRLRERRTGSGGEGRGGRRGGGEGHRGTAPMAASGIRGEGGLGQGQPATWAGSTGLGLDPGWQQRWATHGVADMVATCEALLQIEVRL